MDEVEFQKLLSAEPPVVMNPSLARKFWTLLLIATIIVLGEWLGHQKMQNNPIAPAFFGIFLGGIVAVMSYSSLSTSLILSQNDFTVKKLFVESMTYAWKDVSDIVSQKKVNTFGSKMKTFYIIKFLYTPYGHTHEFERPAYRGITLSQLAQLMNHWRERAITAKSN